MKRLSLLTITAALSLASCVHQSGYDQYQGMKNHETVENLFEAFNEHDFKLMASYYADTAKFLDPSSGKDFVHQSRKQTEDKYKGMAATFTNLKDSTTNVINAGDHVIAQFISTGTSADGKSFSLPMCSVFSFKNGVIVSDATYYDK